MISSNSELASHAGIEMLRRGGNAVDAAVAVGFALAVAHPEAGNIGGGGFMVIRMADGKTAALDYRETAPMAATRDMYVLSNGSVGDRSRIGPLAVGVPGSVAGLTTALQRFGSLPLDVVMAPAIRLARDGITVDTALERSVAGESDLIRRFGGTSVFLPGGRGPHRGELFKQPDLAATLSRIAAHGAGEFYSGETARLLVAEMKRDGGLVTLDDLARYRPIWRDPLRGSYRGYTLLSMPPVSSGGVTLIETLNMLESRPTLPPFGSAAYTHLLAEAFRRAFVDRNTKLGDPAFARIPLDQLMDKEYARQLAGQIDPLKATPTAPFRAAGREGSNTTHYSVVDAQGNTVATTTTLNDLYGSGVFVAGGGFFLNDEMDDFTARPGVPNGFGLVQGEQNSVAPGKRMLSAMSPTIVLDRDGRVLLVVGGRGGPRIITSVAQVIINVLDFGMSLPDAVAAPRIHHQAWPETVWIERDAFSAVTRDSLRAMGHEVATAPWEPGGFSGRIHAVMRTPDGWVGVVDPRTSGGAEGY
jgi:gamma-glutamyltranspeptidase/glutathione hydrolase